MRLRTACVVTLILICPLEYADVGKSQSASSSGTSYTFQDGSNATTYSAVRFSFTILKMRVGLVSRGRSGPLLSFADQFGVKPETPAWQVLIDGPRRMFDAQPAAPHFTKEEASSLGEEAFMQTQLEYTRALVLSWKGRYHSFLKDFGQAGGDVTQLVTFINTWARSRVKIVSDKPRSDYWNQRLIQAEELFDAK